MSGAKRSMTAAQVSAALAQGRGEVVVALDGLRDRAETALLAPENRSAKDWLAVFIHHAGDVAGGLGADLAPPDYVRGVRGRLGLDEWHRRAVEYWRPVPLAKVRAEFDRVVEVLSAAAGRLSDPEMAAEDRIPWAGPYPTWQIIGLITWLQPWPAFVSAASAAGGTHSPTPAN